MYSEINELDHFPLKSLAPLPTVDMREVPSNSDKNELFIGA
jgi:hypothetical protein